MEKISRKKRQTKSCRDQIARDYIEWNAKEQNRKTRHRRAQRRRQKQKKIIYGKTKNMNSEATQNIKTKKKDREIEKRATTER